MNLDAGELIGRYVYNVGKRLPPERRADVARELVSLIGDRVDDELGSGQNREEVTMRVLREMGPPEAVAARYGYQPRMLIGPGSWPAFFKLVKVLPLAFLAIFIVSIPVHFQDGFSAHALAMWAIGYFQSVLINLGVLVLVFIALEWISSFRDAPQAEFDPAKLRPAPAPFKNGKLRPVRLVISIYFSVAVFVLFNFYPNLICIWADDGASRVAVIPLSAIGVHVPLWLLNVWLAGHIVLKTEVLREGNWTRVARWFEAGMGVLGLAVLLATVWASRQWQLDAGFLASVGLSPFDPRIAGIAKAFRALADVWPVFALLILWGIAKNVRKLSRAAA